MMSQRFQFYKKGPAQPVIPDWHTYEVHVSLSGALPGLCAVTVVPGRNARASLVKNNLVKGNEEAGLAWAEKHLCEDVHPGYQMNKTVPIRQGDLHA